jgi:hypothetical protein
MAAPDFVEGFMRELAQEVGKPYSMLEVFVQKYEFITRLRDNWIDSKESLMMLDEKSLVQLGFPILLQKKMIEKIESLKGNSANQKQVD